MTEPHDQLPASEPPPELGDDAPDSRAMRELLQASLPKEPELERGEVLRDVQRALRKRSRGKFYNDAWSTGQTRTAYVLIAVAVVTLLALAYATMVPGGPFSQ